MTRYLFRIPRYLAESQRQFKTNRQFKTGSLLLPDGVKVHQVPGELNAYCHEKFGVPAVEILEARKEELTAQLEEALQAAAPFMPFNNGGKAAPEHLLALEGILRRIAGEGSLDAKLQLGLLYCTSGRHFGHSEDEGLSWLLGAYKQNHSDAPAELGVYFVRKGEWSKALTYLRKGDKQGCPLSRFQLAQIYMQGVPGIPRSPSKAFGLYKRASKSGYPLATVAMVALHLDNEVPDKLPGTAIELLEEAVKDGCKEAMFLLADLYEHGEHGPQDLYAAFELYHAAASLGSAESQLKMGHLNKAGARLGFPVKQNLAEARYWYTLAAANPSDPEVQGKAHFCLGYGLLEECIYSAAIEQFEKAAQLGCVEGEKAILMAAEATSAMRTHGESPKQGSGEL